MSLNCQSLRNKVYSVLNFIEENNIVIACLQETWLGHGDKNVYQSIHEYGYNTIKYERNKDTKKGGGVIIAFKSNLCFKRLVINSKLSF